MYEKTIPLLIRKVAELHPHVPAQYVKNAEQEFGPISYAQLYDACLNVAAGLISIGCKRNDHIGLIADNRKEWLHSSVGIMAIGASDVPRGCDTTAKDMAYLLGLPECRVVFLENEGQVKKILQEEANLPSVKTLITIDPCNFGALCTAANVTESRFTHIPYADLLNRGGVYRQENPHAVESEVEKGQPDDLATIIFTSGTTGEPKGVMLSHNNFITQLPDLKMRIPVAPGYRALSVLPVWHSFERMCEYVMLSEGVGIVYSKPVGSVLLADIAKTNPHLFPSVPRIWESVYDAIQKTMRTTGGITYALFRFFSAVGMQWARFSRNVTGKRPHYTPGTKIVYPLLSFIPFVLLWLPYKLGDLLVFKKIRRKLGTSFLAGISGGGALPPHIDEFFWMAGVNLLEGYGLTETAPVVSVRHIKRPVFGTIGTPISCNEAKILNDEGKPLGVGEQGVLFLRGTNIMQGYYKRPDLTAAVLDDEGWLNTGDIGFMTIDGEIILRGRQKDTIVLRGGENIEPKPIEMKLEESRFISQAVVVGQDERVLGALLVPDRVSLEGWAKTEKIDTRDFSALLNNPAIRQLYANETKEYISAQNGFRLFERIGPFALLEKEFSLGRELSAKQEIMRHKIADIYSKEIKQLFN